MLIGVPLETVAGETRVAVTPETAKKLKAQGHAVRVQSGAGVPASATDAAYAAVGAEIADRAGAFGCDLVLKVRAPQADELPLMKRGTALVGMLNPFDRDGLQRLAGAGLTSFALEAAPRTTRAQSMDVLSSQANIAGYKAVMMAADRYQQLLPDADDGGRHHQGRARGDPGRRRGRAAGHRHGQATGRRDRGQRRAAERQGAGRVAGRQVHRRSLRNRRGEGSCRGRGRLRAADAAELARPPEGRGGQARGAADIVITTALIPGRAAPVLVTEEMVKSMKPGSVIVDLAAPQGGNCPLTEAGKTVVKHGVTLVGETNLPALVAADASALYARNVLDFLKLVFTKEGAFQVPMDDDIVAACLMTHDGEVTRK